MENPFRVLGAAAPTMLGRRETLASLLWPENTGRNARHALSQALYSLRRAIGEMVDDLRNGGLFSSAAAQHPQVFPNYYVGILQAAELTGRLEQDGRLIAYNTVFKPAADGRAVPNPGRIQTSTMARLVAAGFDPMLMEKLDGWWET